MIRILSLALILTACGADSQQVAEELAALQNAPVTGGIQHAPTEKEVVLEYQKVGEQVIRNYATPKEAPACVNNESGRKIYIQSEAAFFICKAGVWSEEAQPVSSERPAPEPDMEATEPEALPEGQWLEPLYNRVWKFVTPNATETEVAQGGHCRGEWRLPQLHELRMAYQGGLEYEGRSTLGTTRWWTGTLNACPRERGAVCLEIVGAQIDEVIGNIPLDTVQIGVVCVKN